MTELKLYKFVDEHGFEYHWEDNNTEVYLFMNVIFLEDFYKLICEDKGVFDNGGVPVHLKDGYFVVEMKSICERCDIILENVFAKN